MNALRSGLAALAAASCIATQAATPVDGIGTQVILPVVSATTTFQTQVFVYNPNGLTLNLTIEYVGGIGTAAAGLKTCTAATVNPDRTLVIDVGTQCTLAGSNFGTLRLIENNAGNLPFTAYARVQNFAGIGFSVEGIPIGNFSLDTIVTGLRSGGSPVYQSNCFVGSFGEAVDYQIMLVDAATGIQLGSTITGSLTANQLRRILDIFTAAGVAPGAYTNVNAYITENTPGAEPALIGLCTVQENSFFSADYRSGKSFFVQDASRERDSTTSASRMGDAFTVNAGSQSNLHEIYFRAPDRVACQLTGPDIANLEMRLLDQATVLADAQAAGGNGRVLGGGSSLNTIAELSLGARSAATNASADGVGVNGRYVIQVEGNETATGSRVYGIRCTSGNGHTRPALIKTLAADVF